ncbi:MAG: NADH-quinone oxidoreductase subunit N [Acidobacteria bacterium]|nr:NADH-quinone oxidoreductase subunit N [Acidobacteriota bacterium]
MNTFASLIPLLIVVGGALLLLLLEAFIKRDKKDYLGYLGVLVLPACGFFVIRSWNQNLSFFDGKLLLDNVGLFFILLLIIATALVILISLKYISLQNVNRGEFYPLLLLALSGMMMMVTSSDLLIIFLGLEVLSISSYALAGIKHDDPKSSEAAVKYFLLGSFASAFIVFGLAFLYGSVQGTDIGSVIAGLSVSSSSLLTVVGLCFIVIGFGFKIAVVPFHMWTPDVYEGSPTPVTAFFSVGPKAVGFAVLLRIFLPYWQSAVDSAVMHNILWVIAVLTMVVGNLIALRQTNVKRILAYSSIAHAGYLLVAILARDGSSLLYYLTVYMFMNIGAFAAIIALSKKGKEYLELEDFSGIGFKYPWIGATFAVFLVSLAGFPPTGGFLAKFYIFSAAMREGMIPLVIIAVLASLISVYYYLRIIIYMYMKPADRVVDIDVENPSLFFVLFLCLYGVLQLGIYPGNVLIFIKQAIASLL